MLVSVIIPTYNRTKTIERAVNSVLNQTWKKIEIIVVDDGSTDQTNETLKAYGDKIRVIHQPNAGASAARNTGIKAATGEIISFLDSDDEWLPSKTERQIKLLQRMESYGVVCCVCNATMLFSAGVVTSFQAAGLNPLQAEGVWLNPADTLVDRFLFFNQVTAVRREALDASGYFREDLKILEDYDLALKLSLIGPWTFIADPLVIWHEDAGSGLSRNVNQLNACQLTLRILNDLSCSVRFGSLLPKAALQHRRRMLRQKIRALTLTSKPSRAHAIMGRLFLFYLRVFEAIYTRFNSKSQMVLKSELSIAS
jgi:glycosyltransferase involved in cell wall biosynthesis